MDNQRTLAPPDPQHAHLGRSVTIKGEVSGSEDLYLDGNVEGSIDLKGNQFTLGPNGRVRANINARSAVIHGKLEGNINASDRVDLKHSATVTGDIVTQRISIDEGAFFKGGVDISRGPAQPEAKSSSAGASGPSTPGVVPR